MKKGAKWNIEVENGMKISTRVVSMRCNGQNDIYNQKLDQRPFGSRCATFADD